jgi:outer membrane protein
MSLPHLPGRGPSTPLRRAANLSALAIVMSAAASTAAAQQPGPEGSGGPGGPGGSSWGLGLGVFSAQKPYTGSDRETKVLPLLQFENQYVKVGALGIEVKLPGLDLGDRQRLDFSIVGRMNLDGAGYEADDAPILAGMAERKGGFWTGAQVQWRNEMANVSVEWLGDVAGKSKGQRFSLSVEKPFRLGPNLMISPRLSAAWLDKKYVDYYFGVRSSEAMAGRPAYVGKAGVVPGVGVRAIYRLDSHHSLMFDARVAGLAKSMKDSPLVDTSTENRVLVGYLYRF